MPKTYILCGPLKEFSRVSLTISHYVTTLLINAIEDIIAVQCMAHHFGEHAEGQFRNVMCEALCADKRSGHGLSLEELRTRGGGGVSYHGTLHSALTISLGSAGGAPRAK